MPSIRIPDPLRKLTNDLEPCRPAAQTSAKSSTDLDQNFPGLKERICDENGKVRRFVNIFLNDEDIRFLDEKATVVKDSDELSIVPAIAGG